jgi:Tfp pilus assembly PilM family ATPase
MLRQGRIDSRRLVAEQETKTMSSSVLEIAQRVSQRFTPSHGLIGVDLGARSIKLAQVERCGSSWKLNAAHVIPYRGTSEPLSEHSIQTGLIADNLESFSAKQAGFRGVRAACALSTQLIEPLVTELPDASMPELRQMILQECDVDNNEVDFWINPATSGVGGAKTRRVSTYSLPSHIATRCAKDLLTAKLQCERIDSVSFALARAVNVTHPSDDTPIASFDWGYHMPMFSVSVNGVPKMTRILRNCALNRLSKAVQTGLGVNEFEAAQLLASVDSAGSCEGNISSALQRLIRPEIQRVGAELQKTMTFLHNQHPALLPQRIWMFGGGATIGGVSKTLTYQVGVVTQPWSLPPDFITQRLRSLQHPSLFGVAIGLSLPATN